MLKIIILADVNVCETWVSHPKERTYMEAV